MQWVVLVFCFPAVEYDDDGDKNNNAHPIVKTLLNVQIYILYSSSKVSAINMNQGNP